MFHIKLCYCFYIRLFSQLLRMIQFITIIIIIPVYPGRQLQLNDPCVFAQVAP